MIVFDQLKKSDPQIQSLTLIVLGGLSVLLAGLWWLQIVRASEYESHLEAQTYRTVRLPALRGRIFDRNGQVLVENRAAYNVSLYLEDFRPSFDRAYDRSAGLMRTQRQLLMKQQEKKLGRELSRIEQRKFALTLADKRALRQDVRYEVASNVVSQIGRRLQQSYVLDETVFQRHYDARLALPYTVVKNLDATQIARFEEQSTSDMAANLELQTTRAYPYGSTAAHVLGYVRRDDRSTSGEEAYFSYRLPDYRGVVGIEGNFDGQLHGRAGESSVLVNNLGYRQEAKLVSEPEPGENVFLTLDLRIQQAAENALISHQTADARGAVVVMDVRSGDVLALVSSPAFDPNDFAQGISTEKYRQLQEQTAEKNRATFENFAPGSIFKTVVALAALENGLNPSEIYHVQENPSRPGRGVIYVGRRSIRDTAPPGDYNFKKAFIHSSNSYFVTNGLRAGVENIVRIGKKFHLGERTGILPGQETDGSFPTEQRVRSGWFAGDTANLCIGQGKIDVTPIQMAVMVSAIANGGKVLWPRLVARLEPQDPTLGEPARTFPPGLVRDELGVHPRSLKIVQEAMLADVEEADGTGGRAAVPGLRICGKTGTAEVQDKDNRLTGYNFWFASYAPYEKPKYAVVVMLQTGPGGGSGGTTCAPIAHDIYLAIQRIENAGRAQSLASQN